MGSITVANRPPLGVELPPGVAYRLLGEDADRWARWTALLSDEERARRADFGHPKRKRSFTLGRAAARLLVSEGRGCAPEAVTLCRDEDGGVSVEGSDAVLSIAHTEPYAVAAIATHALGVDLERIQPRDPDLPRFLFHPDEYGLLERLPLDRAHGVILCWTLKEAALKAQRTGLRTSPKKLRLDVDVHAGRAAICDTAGSIVNWEARFCKYEGCYLTFVYPASKADWSVSA